MFLLLAPARATSRELARRLREVESRNVTFLGEEFPEATDDTLDAAMELGNMVAGCMKERLYGSKFEVANISLPSVVIGAKYDFYYSRGIQTVSVEFELEELPALWTEDRFLSTTISLLRGSGTAS